MLILSIMQSHHLMVVAADVVLLVVPVVSGNGMREICCGEFGALFLSLRAQPNNPDVIEITRTIVEIQIFRRSHFSVCLPFDIMFYVWLHHLRIAPRTFSPGGKNGL
jgi:hypothetical protein